MKQELANREMVIVGPEGAQMALLDPILVRSSDQWLKDIISVHADVINDGVAQDLKAGISSRRSVSEVDSEMREAELILMERRLARMSGEQS
jgi:hypothetical protein